MKRGFTLIEVMAVIIILSVIGVIAVVAVDKTIKDNNEKLYQMQISNIEDAARTWGNANIKYLPDTKDTAISIPLIALKKDDLIDKEIKNPDTGELFYDNMYIDIIYQGGTYIYDVVEDSGTKNFSSLNVPVIILNDTLNKEINIGDTVENDGFVIYDDNTKKDLADVGNVETTLDTATAGTYDYNITVSTFTAKRKITVK